MRLNKFLAESGSWSRREADTLIDTVCWETGNPAVFTPSLKHVERLAAGRTVNVIAHSGRPHHQVLRVA